MVWAGPKSYRVETLVQVDQLGVLFTGKCPRDLHPRAPLTVEVFQDVSAVSEYLSTICGRVKFRGCYTGGEGGKSHHRLHVGGVKLDVCVPF